MDPRFAWKAGVAIGGPGFFLSLIMFLVTSDPNAAAPWKIGSVGFGGVAIVSAAGLYLSHRR
ncbi:MAG: hypothetical protein SFX73_05640 [Kofleriaceae bacterium]|nr:hypothetical protein [Kofleriaceae bacterium]